MWFDPAKLASASLYAPATSATLRLSEELPAVTLPKVAKSQEAQAPRVRAPESDAAKVGGGNTVMVPFDPLRREREARTAEVPHSSAADIGMDKVIDKLRGDPGLIYAMTAHDDIEPEAVILTLAIRDKTACYESMPPSDDCPTCFETRRGIAAHFIQQGKGGAS